MKIKNAETGRCLKASFYGIPGLGGSGSAGEKIQPVFAGNFCGKAARVWRLVKAPGTRDQWTIQRINVGSHSYRLCMMALSSCGIYGCNNVVPVNCDGSLGEPTRWVIEGGQWGSDHSDAVRIRNVKTNRLLDAGAGDASTQVRDGSDSQNWYIYY